MNGILALQGGGPFAANDDLDRRLLKAAGATRVVMLPTADAYEHPERLVAAAVGWAERLDVDETERAWWQEVTGALIARG